MNAVVVTWLFLGVLTLVPLAYMLGVAVGRSPQTKDEIVDDEELDPTTFLPHFDDMSVAVEHVSAKIGTSVSIDEDLPLNGGINEIPTIAVSFNNEDFEDPTAPIYILAVPVVVGMIMVLSTALNELNINPLMAIPVDPPQEPSKNDL